MRENVEERMQRLKELILEDVKKIQKLVFVVWRNRSVSAVLRRSQSWSVLTRMWSSATTPMSLSSPLLRRRFVRRTLRKFAPSLSNNKLTMRLFRSATNLW